MKQAHFTLRLVLLTVCVANFYAAYLFFINPEVIGDIYQLTALDNMHRFLTMNIGGLMSAFGFGALIAFFRPVKYASVIIVLLLMHFMVFIVDVIVLARAQMPWQIIVPEMIYFLVVSTALVRWYPVQEKAPKPPKSEPEPKPEVVKAEPVEMPEETTS